MLGAPAIPLISGDKSLVGRPFRGDITQAQEVGALAPEVPHNNPPDRARDLLRQGTASSRADTAAKSRGFSR